MNRPIRPKSTLSDSQENSIEEIIPLGESGLGGLNDLCQNLDALSNEIDALADGVMNADAFWIMGQKKGKKSAKARQKNRKPKVI